MFAEGGGGGGGGEIVLLLICMERCRYDNDEVRKFIREEGWSRVVCWSCSVHILLGSHFARCAKNANE